MQTSESKKYAAKSQTSTALRSALQPAPKAKLRFDFKHFLTGEELSPTDLRALLDTAEDLRLERKQLVEGPLAGKTFALVFEKPSLRTRVSFTVGVQELGGTALVLDSAQKKYEEPEDTMRVMQGMVHGIMLRTFDHGVFEKMAKVANIPIINGLSDQHHPCQALADLLTLKQKFGELKGLTVAYIGDGNNILHSWMLLASAAGVNVHYACPEDYQPDPEILRRASARAALFGTRIQKFATPDEAVVGVDAISTDVWTSMGAEAETAKRDQDFAGYQVNAELVSKAQPKAIVLHCLPMVRGKEITSEVVEGPQSALFQQAENRLHAQKALLYGIYNAVGSR